MNKHTQYTEEIKRCEALYISSLLQGKWLGTEGQAWNIYERFLDRIEKETLLTYEFESKNEFEILQQKRMMSGTIYMIPLRNWIYANKVVEYAVSKRIKLNKL